MELNKDKVEYKPRACGKCGGSGREFLGHTVDPSYMDCDYCLGNGIVLAIKKEQQT